MGTSAEANAIEKINMDGVPENLVFGLDIGTRSIVGTVGYRDQDGKFVVVAQTALQHETRAMLDGQIHDIGKVAETISKVHKRLEEMTERTYKDVCIAAAGRVLKTVEESAEVIFPNETVVTNDHVYSLDMLAIEKAHADLREQEGDAIHFYCVGYSVKQYFQNDYPISNLEGHKCTAIRTELIATFLPDEVVDGLYAAVERAGLYVANLTLEPIAAINVAIPERFRLLNIALVDVGAGTSDISITKDGSIIAYGMIPCAGDELTECLAKHYLTDFQEADRLKCASTLEEEVTFHDIMGLPQRVPSTEIAAVLQDTVQMITKSVADKIIELNGGKTVSAVFVVGGGGKITGFVESLAEHLDLMKERVALRGNEVLGDVRFLQEDVNVDSLLVTPIGICMNYYEQRNNFIFVYINQQRIRLYDNNKLTILDAALQVGLPNEVLFPQRGDALTYYINGETRMLRGEPGEAAVIRLNGEETGISEPIKQNDQIEVTPSTKGKAAELVVGSLPEYKATLSFYVNGTKVSCPRFVSVNGNLVSAFYSIQNEDQIQVLDYYTLQQVLEFMDIVVEGEIRVNNLPAEKDTKIYENFSVDCVIENRQPQESSEPQPMQGETVEESLEAQPVSGETAEESLEPQPVSGETVEESSEPQPVQGETVEESFETAEALKETPESEQDQQEDSTHVEQTPSQGPVDLLIHVNAEPVTLRGKSSYIMVDVLDFYPIDTAVAHGDRLEIKLNGRECTFMEPLHTGDQVTLQWIELTEEK